jgi:hypothetical protein
MIGFSEPFFGDISFLHILYGWAGVCLCFSIVLRRFMRRDQRHRAIYALPKNVTRGVSDKEGIM